MDLTPWLLVAGDFTPFGGMDAANHALARYLAARGEVHLVTHRASRDLTALSSVTVHHVARPFEWHVVGSALLSRAGRRVWRRLVARGVRTVINGGNCSVEAANWVHFVHAAHVPAVAGSILRRSKAALLYERDRAAERIALREAGIVICNSHRTRNDVIEHVGVEASRAHVVYYGCDPVRFAPVDTVGRAAQKRTLGFSPDRPLVGFVGALGDRRKAFDTLFASWVELCRHRIWDADLLVVGAGAELSMWRQRVRDAGLDARIRFAGFRRDMPDLFAAFDVLVHPARYEAYGLSVQEAICRGVPALVSARAGVVERFPPHLRDLLIADPDDAHEIADRLRAWREDPDRFRALTTPLAQELRARTWDAMAEDIVRLVAGTS